MKGMNAPVPSSLPQPLAEGWGEGVRVVVDFNRRVFALLGLPVDALNLAGAVARVRDAALSSKPCFVSTPNLNFLVAAQSDAAFRDSVAHSDISLPDGMPLVWVARLLGLPIHERVAGADLFEAMQSHAPPAVSVFFFGGPDGAAQAACRHVNECAGGVHCVGFDAPGFVPVEAMSDDDRIDRINRSGAQFVVAALGAKKGQAWLVRNRERLSAPVLCHLGAVVNFAAGSVKRSPHLVQRLGLEWLWRIKEEPALCKRYASDGLRFLGMLWRCVLPQVMATRLRLPRTRSMAPAELSVHDDPAASVLALEGAWTEPSLQPLRDALTRLAALADKPLWISLREVSHVDSAFIGLLMLAPRAFPSGLRIVDVRPAVQRCFERHGAGHLLSKESSLRA